MPSRLGQRKWDYRQLSWLMGLVVISSFLACSADSTPAPEVRLGLKVDKTCPASDREDYYYPRATVVGNEPSQDDFLREWFSRYLRTSGAAPLWCAGSSEAYRLLWLPSYRPAILIDLIKQGDGWQLTRVLFTDPRLPASGTQASPFAVNARIEQRVSDQSVSPFVRALSGASYWTRPAYIGSDVEDGHLEVIEARRGDLYRAVTRRAGEEVKFDDAARALVTLAGLEIPDEMKTRQP